MMSNSVLKAVHTQIRAYFTISSPFPDSRSKDVRAVRVNPPMTSIAAKESSYNKINLLSLPCAYES